MRELIYRDYQHRILPFYLDTKQGVRNYIPVTKLTYLYFSVFANLFLPDSVIICVNVINVRSPGSGEIKHEICWSVETV